MTSCRVLVVLCVWSLLGTRNNYGANAVNMAVKKALIAEHYRLFAIQNGYDKPPVNHVRPYKIKESIREEKKKVQCGLTFIALSYMRISKIPLQWTNGHDSLLMDMAVAQIESFGQHAFNSIVVLYNVGLRDCTMGMWHFYLYTTLIRSFRTYIGNRSGNDYGKTAFELSNVHDTVTGILSEYTRRCAAGNRLNVAGNESDLYERYKVMTKIKVNPKSMTELLAQYKSAVNGLMADNGRLAVANLNGKKLCISRLYLNNVALDDDTMAELQTKFDWKIHWGNTAGVLKSMHDVLARNPSILFDGLRAFQKYHSAFKAVLKTVMYRITWTHLLLLEESVRSYKTDIYKQIDITKNNDELLEILKLFVDFLNLRGDAGLNKLLVCLRNESFLCVTSAKGVDLIKSELSGLATVFDGIDAKTDVVKTGAELKANHDRLMRFAEVKNLPTEYRAKPVKNLTRLKRNFQRAYIFVMFISHRVLRHVDFGLMSSLFSSGSVAEIDKIQSAHIVPEQPVSQRCNRAAMQINDKVKSIVKHVEISIQMEENIIENVVMISIQMDDTIIEKFVEVSIQMEEAPIENYIEVSIQMENVPNEEYIEVSIQMVEAPIEKYVEISIQMEKVPNEEYIEVSRQIVEAPIEKDIEVSIQIEDAPIDKYIDISTQVKEAPIEKCIEVPIQMVEAPNEKDTEVSIQIEEAPIKKCIDISTQIKDFTGCEVANKDPSGPTTPPYALDPNYESLYTYPDDDLKLSSRWYGKMFSFPKFLYSENEYSRHTNVST